MAFIKADKISFEYKKGNPVLQGLSIAVNQEQITAVVGENGSGKTTLGKLLTGILKPVDGKIFIDNKNTHNMTLSDVGMSIGYLFQNPSRQLFATTVKEQMLFTDQMMDKDMMESERRMMALLDYFDLQDKITAYTYELSQGEKQRLALASVLINTPRFLVLDEPTTGLDTKRKKQLSNYLEDLKGKRIGMMIISHDQDFVRQHAQRIITLSKGEIIHDAKYIR